jgi:hypothetical protein
MDIIKKVLFVAGVAAFTTVLVIVAALWFLSVLMDMFLT